MYVKIPAITKYRSINVFFVFCNNKRNFFFSCKQLMDISKTCIYMVFIPVNLLIIFVEYILVRYKRITPTITTAT